MARSPSLLSSEPTNIVHQPVSIGHVQLRDLVICPEERGVVDFIQGESIMERDVTNPASTSTTLVELTFTPNTLASLSLPDSNERLIAAGGQHSEFHLSIHSKRPSLSRNSSSSSDDSCTAHDSSRFPPLPRTRRLWQYDNSLGGSINNSVLLTQMSLTRSHESSAEPRVAVSNNDCSIKFYDINVRGSKGVDGPPTRISEVGTLKLDVAVNHSSISPDGRTLLSVGDSPHVYLHGLTGGSRITFTPYAKLTLPPFDSSYHYSNPNSNCGPASFSTGFSACGTKFAVASQEGMVAVWDVRSTKPMKIFETDRTRSSGSGRTATGAASGWLYEDSWDWSNSSTKAPGWGVRNVKFSPGSGGKQLMTFTEHTSLLHVVDATTFETEEIVKVPTIINERSDESCASARQSANRYSTEQHDRTSSGPWTSSARLPPVPQTQPRVFYNSSSERLSASSASTISPARAQYFRRSRRRNPPTDGENNGVVVIPALGDRGAEREVRRVLVRHGLRASVAPVRESPGRQQDREEAMVDPEDDDEAEIEIADAADFDEREIIVSRDPSRTSLGPYHETEDVEMEVDELESDCFTSRASSPAPFSSSAPTPWSVTTSRGVVRSPAAARTQGQSQSQRIKTRVAVQEHLDLAGTCFDPSGRWVYVASTGGLVEWSVKGAEKTWWDEGAWA